MFLGVAFLFFFEKNLGFLNNKAFSLDMPRLLAFVAYDWAFLLLLKFIL